MYSIITGRLIVFMFYFLICVLFAVQYVHCTMYICNIHVLYICMKVYKYFQTMLVHYNFISHKGNVIFSPVFMNVSSRKTLSYFCLKEIFLFSVPNTSFFLHYIRTILDNLVTNTYPVWDNIIG